MWLSGCANPNAGGPTAIREIDSAAALKTEMEGGNVTVIHALDREHFARAHIPGAVHCDYELMDQVASERLPADKSRSLVFYCAGPMCPVSRRAASKATQMGYTSVAVYEGGIRGWQAAGFPVETDP
jgi:rhodanese-related sulfurtransferase